MKKIILSLLLVLLLTGCKSNDVDNSDNEYISTIEILTEENEVLQQSISDISEQSELLRNQMILLEEKNLSLIEKNESLTHTVSASTITEDTLFNMISNTRYNLTSEDIREIIDILPIGWYVSHKNSLELAITKGDLNKDDIDDLVFVIEGGDQNKRHLMILFGEGNDTYTYGMRALSAVMGQYSGGGFGDPLADLYLKDGKFVLAFYGGGGDKFFMDYEYLYDVDGFKLVRVLTGWHITLNGERAVIEDDYNLVTGEYTSKYVEDGKIVSTSGVNEIKELIKLEDFEIESSDNPYFQ